MNNIINKSTSLDENYLKWKSWGGNTFASLSKNENSTFTCETSRTKTSLPKNSKVLDVGFGNGSFLAFAKRNEWDVTGTEVNAELVETARSNGFNVELTDNLSIFPDSFFDLIVAFDVLEHIPQDLLPIFIADAKRLLKKGGCLIARFPNGDTPFGLVYQNGDITHVTSLGSGKIKYFAAKFDLDIVYLGGEAHPILGTTLKHSAHRLIAFPFKLVINFFVNTIIFPGAKVAFCSPNMTVVYRVKS